MSASVNQPARVEKINDFRFIHECKCKSAGRSRGNQWFVGLSVSASVNQPAGVGKSMILGLSQLSWCISFFRLVKTFWYVTYPCIIPK